MISVPKRKANVNDFRRRSSFFGRQTELAWLRENWRLSPLISVVGPPGIGKTSLARRLCETLIDQGEVTASHTWLVDLSEVRTVSELVDQLGRAVGGGGTLTSDIETAARQLAAILGKRDPGVLVLDNVDRLVGRLDEVLDRLLRPSTDVTFLATSRERLSLEGERILELGPLGTSAPAQRGRGGLSDAAALFIDRASVIEPRLNADESVVAKIVHMLDGIPLNIELAAARANVLDLQEMLRRLEHRLDMLTRRHPDATSQHRSLRAALESSWDLLTEGEQAVLAQCSVFHGGFDVDGAEGVVTQGESATGEAIIDILQRLRERSLLAVALDRPLRFKLYQGVHEFASERLAACDQRRATERRHGAYFARVGLRWRNLVHREGQLEVLAQLALERHNLVAAVSFGLDAASPESIDEALTALLALELSWSQSGHLEAYQTLLRRALKAATESAKGPMPTTARVLNIQGRVLTKLGQTEPARASLQNALKLASDLGQDSTVAESHSDMAVLLWREGRFEEAARCCDKADAAVENQNKPLLRAHVLTTRGNLMHGRGDLDQAYALFQKALRLFRTLGSPRHQSTALANLGVIKMDRGHFEAARSHLMEALKLAIHSHDVARQVHVFSMLGLLFHQCHRLALARSCYRRCLELASDIGRRDILPYTLANLAEAYLDSDDDAPGQSLLEQAIEVAEECNNPKALANALEILGTRVHWRLGRLERALDALDRAAQAVRESELPSQLPRILAAGAAICFDQGDEREARRRFDDATAALIPQMTPIDNLAFTLLRSPTDILPSPPAKVDRLDGPLTGLLIEALSARAPDEAHPWGRPSNTQRSALVRMAAERLTARLPRREARHLSAQALDTSGQALLVEPGGAGFRAPGGQWVDLSSRASHPGLLECLVNRRLTAPGTYVEWTDLLEAGWPGERISTASGYDRIRTAIRALRRTGLAEVLLSRRQEGYALKCSVPLIVA